MRNLAIILTLMCTLVVTGIVGSSAASLPRATVTDAGSYTVTTSPNARFSVPTFGPGAFLTVKRGKTGSATFQVTSNSYNISSVYATITSANSSLRATLTPSSATPASRGVPVTCTLTINPRNTMTPGNYVIEATITATGTAYSSAVRVSIPVAVTY